MMIPGIILAKLLTKWDEGVAARKPGRALPVPASTEVILMLRKMNEIIGMDIIAGDGEVGRIDDLYFDDERWVLRYFVVETGNWLSSRKVLLSPESIESFREGDGRVRVHLSREQIKNAPLANWARPISRQYERELRRYFNWTPYWLSTPLPIAGIPHPPPVPPEERKNEVSRSEDDENDEGAHLRSGREVIGYYIHAQNGDIGHVEDILLNDEDWHIDYFLVDTRNWLPGGKKVMVATEWIEKVVWPESSVYVEITREVIKNSPAYDASGPSAG